MCGIVGAIALRPDPSLTLPLAEVWGQWLDRALPAMDHRGPDAHGRFVDGRVALGATRLRIHDTNSRADQPMFSPDKRRIIIFNGAIHNWRELRLELEQLGVNFSTRSDTEVAMACLERWGGKAFARFDGMFSIAYLDRGTGAFLLGRDRLGVKPLFFHLSSSLFAFASEIKPLLAHPAVPRRINRAVVPELLAYQFVMPPDTLFDGIEVLPPGHYLAMNVNGSEPPYSHCYWQADSTLIDDRNAPHVDEALVNSLRHCWDADRATGIQLSGGVDSSLVTAFSHEKLGRRGMSTYSVVFDDDTIRFYDPRSEENYIRQVAERYGCSTDLHMFGANAVRSALAEAVWYHEHPLHGPSTSLYMLFARAIREKVTVLLTGEGADDIFLGYFADWSFNDDPLSLFKWFVGRDNITHLFGAEGVEHAAAKRISLAQCSRLSGMSPGQRASVVTMETVLHGLLARHDRMFMSNSIEGRVPFCSIDLIRARFALPDSQVHDGSHGKLILKRLLADRMGNDFAFRKKIGFSVPFGDWCSDPAWWRGYVEAIEPDFIAGFADPTVFLEWRKLPHGQAKWSQQNLNLVFSLAQFQLWHRIFFESADLLDASAWRSNVPATRH